ncbi:MAG: hypothetical protein K2L55_01755 [Muribaculaceae bacterium]|nr:hypothetical protein [Muribaculaceae bacterium]
MTNDNKQKLYNALSRDYELGTFEKFCTDIDDSVKRRKLFDAASQDYELGSWESFSKQLGYTDSTQEAPLISSIVRKVEEQAKQHVSVTSAASGNAGANVSAEASEQAAPAEAAPVDRGQQSWMPSVQDRVRASYQMQTVADGLSHRADEGAAKVGRINEPLTAEGREHRKQKEMEARMAGAPTTLLGLTGPSKAKADEEKSSAPTEKAELRPDVMSPVPYGVEYVDGKAVTKWLMPDGSVTTNMAEADAVEYTARQQRLHDTYLKNTKDISIDIPKEKSIRVGVSESYGKPVIIWRLPDGSLKKSYATPDDEKFIKENQEKFDEFGGNLISYKFNQEAADIVQPKAKEAAEQAWKAAEAAYGEKMEYNRRNSNIWLSSAGNSTDAASIKQLETIDNFTDRLTTHDLDALMDAAWSNLGEAGQKSLIDDCYKILQRQNPETDKIALYNLAKDYARQQSDKSLYNLAVEKNMPKNGLDYFMRKISDMNFVTNLGKGIAVNRVKKTGDMAAYEAANEQYRQDGHKILDVTGMVAGFAFDPTTWLSAGVGGAATRGTMWLGGRWMAGRGASTAVKQAATRQFANTMTGRLVGGVVGGSVNFGTFEGTKELENQFAHGGHIVGQDETGRYINEGYSASAVGGQVLHGLGMGAAIGWLGPVTGNVSDKLVRATTSTLGKVATRAGIYTGATIAEGTIFSIPEWIEGGRDGFDVWTDNMAMMAGFKAKHMVKSAGGILRDLKASFESPSNGSKNRLNFESCLRQRMDAPSDGGLALTKDEQAELQRYGYDLRDLVESAERTGNAKEGGIIAQNAPEIVSRLTDMVTDPRVSEAARAKMYYYATGRKLPMSTVMRGELFEDGNGGFVVESLGANGVITSRSFTNRKAADLELERIRRQSELNQLELGERYQPIADFESRMMEASRRVAANHGWNPVDVYKTCEDVLDSYVRGNNKELSDVQKNIYNKILAELDKIEVSDLATEKRTRINAKYDVDIDKAIRKEPNRRTEAEQKAIDEYIAELMPRRNSGNGMFDEAGQRLLPAEGEPRDVEDVNYREADETGQTIEHRFKDDYDFVGVEPHKSAEQPLGRAVMKYQDRQVEVLDGRVVMTGDGTMIDCERSEKTIVVRDIATGKVEMVSPEAILSYEGYADEGELLDAPISPESPSVGESVGAESTGAISAAPNYDLYDTFSVNIEGRDRPLPAAVVERDGNTITIWTPEAVNQASAKSRTMRGYLTDLTSADLDAILQRDAEGNPVGYVSANPPQETEARTDLSHTPVDGQGQPKHEEAGSDAAPDVIAGQAQVDEATATADTAEYDRGYEQGLEDAAKADDAWIANLIKIYSQNTPESMPEIMKGRLDAFLYEQQRRAMEAQSVPNPAAPVENGQQTADDGFISIDPAIKPDENGNINIPAPEAQAEPTPLQRIPRDEQGEPILTHESVDADTAWGGAVEFFGSEDDARSYVDAQVKSSEAAITAAEKAVGKVKPTAGMTKYREDLKNARVAVDAAKSTLARWKEIAEVHDRQKAEVEEAKAAENAFKASITQGKAELEHAYEEVKDVPEAVEILRNMEPQSIDEVAAMLLTGSKVLWNDEGVKRGMKSMLGYGEGERKGLFGLFAASKNGGETLERLAEDKMKELCEAYGIEYDNYDALTALTDVLGACRTRGDLHKYIQNRRIAQALQMKDDFVRHVEKEAERMSQEAYHMSVADREAYESQLPDEMKKIDMKDADIVEMNAIFADEIIERQRYEENIRNEQGRADSVLPAGSDVLHGEQADYGGGIPETSAGERRIGGDGGVDRQNGAAPESTPDREQGNVIEEAYQRNVTRYDRTVPATPEAQRSAISRIIDFAKNVRNRVERAVIGGITKRQAKDFADNGIDVDETWVHSFESSAVVHNQGRHGDSRTEERAGQIAITSEDYARIPEILEAYDRVTKSPNRSRSTGNEVIIYEKDFDDGYIYYLEEKRDKRKSLSFQTMYKKKKGTDSSDGLMPVASPSTPTAPPDNLSSSSEGKGINFASDKQTDGVGSYVQPADNKGAQTIQTAVEAASSEVNTEPTEAQKAAGNYKMKHRRVDGYNISIENAKGSVRRGTGADGKPWETTMQNDYGYIRGTEGVDGDHIDVFLSDTPEKGDVFVVDQVNEDGSFDEHKVMYGFPSEEAARAAYLSNYEPGWTGLGEITHVSKDEFKKWINSSRRKTKPFADYKSVRDITNNVKQAIQEILVSDNYRAVVVTDSSGKETYRVLLNKGARKKEWQIKSELHNGHYSSDGYGTLIFSSRNDMEACLDDRDADIDILNKRLLRKDDENRRKKRTEWKASMLEKIKGMSTEDLRHNIELYDKAPDRRHDEEKEVIDAARQELRLRDAAVKDATDDSAEITRLSKKYRSAPIKVVKSIEDIKSDDLSEDTLEEIAGAMEEAETQAIYCKENKKIYIFAGKYQDGELDYIVAHESVHAAVDKLGLRNGEELNYYRKSIAGIFDNEAPAELNKIISEKYAPEDEDEEFLAYTLPWISRNKKRMRKVLEHGEGRLVDFINQLNEEIYGKEEIQSMLSATEERTPTNVHGGRGGQVRGRRGTAGTITGDDSGGDADTGNRQIEDFGEKIAGARKDALSAFAKTIENVSVQSLIELPMSKAFTRPNLRKMVETGAISDEDAILAEAILQGQIYAHRKPALTKRQSSKKAVEEWARATYGGISMLGEILSGDPSRREAAILQYNERLAAELEAANAHVAKMREWNPGKKIEDVKAIPNPIDITRRVLEGIGYHVGDAVKLPLTNIELSSNKQYYIVGSAGKQGALWFKMHHDTLDGAVDTMIMAAKLARGDRDVELPLRQFVTKGVGTPHKELTGKYEVLYFAKDGKTVKSRVFDGKDKAEVFAADSKGLMRELVKYTNDFDAYAIEAINPLTGERHTLRDDFGSRAEASTWIDESYEEANNLALDALYKEMNVESTPRSHYYVESVFRHGKMVGRVVEDDKKNPWRLTKYFESRKEADEWLAANAERLETERKAHLDQKRKVVYFKNTDGERQGVDYRGGEDATPEMFGETFGFRGVQFGNWTNNADRQAALNQAYDALMDLSNELGITPRAVSLDGELGLAFGARGTGGATAHYEPVEVVINLTKTKGAGALAHEWWHAVDNFLSRKAGVAMGYATARNGLEGMRPEIREAVAELMDALDNSAYARRSRDKGDYWGRPTELGARLFAAWLAERMKERGVESPFLTTGLSEAACDMYQRFNYIMYEMRERDKAEIENREPGIMSREEFNKLPESLHGYPYPTAQEIEDFGGHLSTLFGAMSEREKESGSIANERGGRYKKLRSTTAGMSLFDWADAEEIRHRHSKSADEKALTAEVANNALDEYAEAYNNYLDRWEDLERRKAEVDKDSMEAQGLQEAIEQEERMAIEARERLIEALSDYYLRDNTPEDTRRIARDMAARVQAEVEIRRDRNHILSDILTGGGGVEPIDGKPEQAEAKQVKTAGGNISYNALGHLPDAKAGEFAYVERQFSRTGDFLFTGNGVIKDRGDVAYLFKALEDYSIEHVFAAFVKDGKVKVLHIGMGGPTSSFADLGAIRAGYDAFGADAVYLVHNHPSGNLSASVPDMRLMKTLEAAFGDEVAVGGIIIDTTSGRYTTFGGTGETGRYDMKQNGGEDAVDVMRFDGVDRSAGRSESVIIANSADIARYVSERRLGAGDKISYLVLSNRNEIVGNFHTDYDKLDASGLAEEIASVTTKYGGTRAVVYGNVKINKARELSAEVSRLSLGAIKMLDAIEVTNGINRSANDDGLLYEPGSEFSDTQNGEKRYRELENDARQQEMAQTSPEAKGAHVEKLANKFNTPIRIVNDINELRSENAEQQERMRRSKAFYVSETGEITVVLPNNTTVEDVAESVLHEVVAHKGLREMIGEENYDAFCDEVYKHLKGILKRQIDKETARSFMREPEKGYEYHRRVAVDELFGRLSEKGFEDFTEPERGIWKKLKAKVLEAINKFLGSLKLPKWVKLGDNELRYILWRSHERLRNKDYVDMARDIAKREELGLRSNEAVRERKSAEEVTADRIVKTFDEAISGDLKGKPVEVGRLTKEGKEYLEKLSGIRMKEDVSFVLNPSDLVHIYRRHYGDNEKDVRNIPLTKEDIRQMSEIVSTPDRIVYGKEADGNQRNMFFFLKEAVDGSYNLMEVYSDRKGNLTAKSFFKSKEGVSQRVMLLNESSTLTSVTDGATLSDAAKLPKFFENPTIAEEESFEYRFRDGETGDIWKDQSVGLEERITNAAIRLSNNHSGDLSLRNDAQKAVIDNLQSLLHEMRNRRGTARSFVGADRKVESGVVDAMNAQAMFDRATVKRVSNLARILLQNGYLSDMTSGEMQRLLSAVKNSTAMHDIADSVQKIMDIMVNNQLRNAEGALRQLLSIRGSKVDARGVEVQGVLDVEGQRTMEVVKDAISLTEDDITDRIDEALNRMSDPNQTIADNAAIEYVGLNMALDYVQNIANSKTEEKTLRDGLKRAKEDRDAGRMTDDAYKQFVETAEDAIRKNKIERAEAYFNLVGRLSDSLRGSIENAKAFREAEKARVNEIHHNANSDMEGRPANEHHKDDWKDKFANNGFVQFFFAPLGTFDQILRVFGNKSANGEGYLWNRFMRGWVDCRNKELLGVKEKYARLDEKAAELFGKGKTWGNLIRMEAKMPKATVSFWDGDEMRDHELTQGNLLYIYMVDKMTDGRMKLRRMGITENDIAKIENFLDPRFKALGDWLQEEFLVDTRNEYNETHKRMFGASMAAIDNYFPLKILKNARVDKEEDVNQQNRPDGITTKTGSIIKRRVNNLALDITGADALSVILDHIIQMEHWNAYAEWNRDLNTLRTYKRFRNQVVNMTTVYGGGEELWENFNNLFLMAAGEYRPPVSKLNKRAVNLAKGVTAAKVSFRIFTALKQFLSAPAYAPEVDMRAIAKSIANPYGDFKWCMENMPIFRERWHSRISGDPRLLKSDMDWKMWRSRVMEMSSRIGMTPNAFVDAVTVSIGARAMYETRLKQYLKEGYPTDVAEKRAMQDATILFNQTQQSSESPFLSTMQVDKDWFSTMLTIFRNSSMSYTRQTYDAARNLKRNLTPGQRAKSVEFMTKQILRDWGVNPDAATDAERGKAEDAAKNRFRRQIKKDVIRVATFGYVLEWLWNLGPYLPYIIFGYYVFEKDKMLDDVFTHSFFGSIEGLTGGDVMSAFGNMALSGEWSRYQLTKDMPLASDINTIIDKFIGGKNAEGFNDIISLVVQMGVGMNPQSITDAVIAITDACGDDPALSLEAAIFAMRVLQVPQSQLDKLYFDNVDFTGKEASKYAPEQLAARYAEYKVKRGTPLMPWAWGDEEQLDKYKKEATKIMKERLDSQGDTDVNEAYADFEARYQTISEEVKKAEALIETDYVAAAQAYAALQQDPDFTLYQWFGSLDTELGRISKMWLTSKTPEEAALIASTISAYRAGMVKVLQAETEETQQSAMSELTTLMNEFYTKYQAMRPQPQ